MDSIVSHFQAQNIENLLPSIQSLHNDMQNPVPEIMQKHEEASSISSQPVYLTTRELVQRLESLEHRITELEAQTQK